MSTEYFRPSSDSKILEQICNDRLEKSLDVISSSQDSFRFNRSNSRALLLIVK